MQNAIDYKVLQKVLKENELELNVTVVSSIEGTCDVCNYLSIRPLIPTVVHLDGLVLGEFNICPKCSSIINKAIK